ncbi:MAG TPA: hypothetical protein VM695_08660 [Phycisphaerae bacterium]|nr:hypothetical protein [Phycisphaerae bacterium]
MANPLNPLSLAGMHKGPRAAWSAAAVLALAGVVWAAGATSRPAPAWPRKQIGQTQLYLTFVINGHEFIRHEHSARTLGRLIDLFERHKLRAELYLTAPLVEAYLAKKPELIAKLKRSRMTISYHYRPPHPACFRTPAGRELATLGWEDRLAAFRGLERRGWDAATGRTRSQGIGGYALVKNTFGRAPVACGTGAVEPGLRRAELAVLREMGLRAVVTYHESGSDDARPLMYRDGLLVRPADFAIARYLPPDAHKPLPPPDRLPFWWNRLAAGDRRAEPTDLLKQQMARLAPGRVCFAPCLIHENDFFAQGVAWRAMYFDADGRPLRPPYAPPDERTLAQRVPLRSPAEAEAIWAAYERLVAYVAGDPRIRAVTSEDLLAMIEPPSRPDAHEAARPRKCGFSEN